MSAVDPIELTRLLVVRHGESEWNALGRWQGQADPALSARGEAQAKAAARLLQREGTVLDAIVSSDLARARRTAELMAETLRLPAPLPETGLRERCIGEWSGLTHAEIETRWPGALGPPRQDPPGGEIGSAVQNRVVETVASIVTRWAGATVAIVTHGGVVRALERAVGEAPGDIPNLIGWWITAPGPDPATWIGGERRALAPLDADIPARPAAP